MKLLSVNLARSLWYCYVSDFNPKGKSLFPVMKELMEIYKFKTLPSPQDLFSEKATEIVFKGGEFTNSEGNIVSINFTILAWGLIADTISSTQDSDAFLSQMLNHFSEKYGFVRYEQVVKRVNYVSQLNVSTDIPLELINPKLKGISQYLTENVTGHGNVPFQTGSISFWPDQVRPVHPPPFTIERIAGVPFSENRYSSVSPLETDKHLELLNRLESVLSS